MAGSLAKALIVAGVAMIAVAAGLAYWVLAAEGNPSSYTSGEMKVYYIVPAGWTFAIFNEDFERIDKIVVDKGDTVVLVALPSPFVPEELHEEIEKEAMEKLMEAGVAQSLEQLEEFHEEAEKQLGREAYGVEFIPHGVAIEGYENKVNVDLSNGLPRVIVFEASEPGAFDIYCSVFCGVGHGYMVLDDAFVVNG